MAQFGNGVVWEYDADTSTSGAPTYAPVGEIVDVNFGGISADTLDSTVHGDAWRSFVAGLKDAGEVTITFRFGTEETSHKALLDDIGVGPGAHKFEWPLNTAGNTTPFSIVCDGIITNVSPSVPHDDLLEASATIKLSGQPTITAEAA